MNLEDHLEERINSPLYSVLKANLVTFIRVVLELNEFDETTILKVAAKLDTNSFEIRPVKTKNRIRGVFLQASMFSHDCLPNTRHVFDENMQIMCVATGKIYYINTFEFQKKEKTFLPAYSEHTKRFDNNSNIHPTAKKYNRAKRTSEANKMF